MQPSQTIAGGQNSNRSDIFPIITDVTEDQRQRMLGLNSVVHSGFQRISWPTRRLAKLRRAAVRIVHDRVHHQALSMGPNRQFGSLILSNQ